MAKKIKTPLQVAIDAIDARHELRFKEGADAGLWQPEELLSDAQMELCRHLQGELVGLSEAMDILRKLDTK